MGVTLVAQERVVKDNYERSIADLEIPTPLSEKGRKAAQTIRAFMKKNGLGTGGCKAFYSPKEWLSRGEDYGLDSELVVVYDGGDLYYVMNPHYADYPSVFYGLQEELEEELKKAGVYSEACYGWHGAIYPN